MTILITKAPPILPPFVDIVSIVKDATDPTKQLRFELGGFTTGTTRVLTPPNANATIAGLEVANVFTAAQKINVNSTAALFVEQDGVKNDVLVVDTTNAVVGINTVPNIAYKLHMVDARSVAGISARTIYADIDYTLGAGTNRNYGQYIDIRALGTGDSLETFGVRSGVAIANTGTTSLAVGVYNEVTMTASGTVSALYSGLYSAKINTSVAGAITTFVGVESQIETGAATTTTVTNAFLFRGTNSLSGGTFNTVYGLFIPSITQGATNYSIRTGLGLHQFGDRVKITQPSATAVAPTLFLEQLDLSEEFIEFNGTVATGNPIEAVGAKTLTTTHFIRVSVNGSFVYIPVGTIA